MRLYHIIAHEQARYGYNVTLTFASEEARKKAIEDVEMNHEERQERLYNLRDEFRNAHSYKFATVHMKFVNIENPTEEQVADYKNKAAEFKVVQKEYFSKRQKIEGEYLIGSEWFSQCIYKKEFSLEDTNLNEDTGMFVEEIKKETKNENSNL